MDNKKDIEQNMENNTNSSVSKKEFNPIDFFQKDESFVFVYKKTEKLATALYMVTNLFSDSEPMKWTLRTKVSQLLSFIIGFKDILESRESEFVNEIKTKVLEIVSLLEISFRSGLVSPMNFSILKFEFVHLIDFLSHFKKPIGHRMDLQENFFEIPKVHHDTKQEHRREGDIGHHDVLDTHKRTNRQNIIINLLKKKKDLNINDIAQTIRDCSEKTIQRELISLIQAGVVQKIGERRWSRYSLLEA
jgi:DNA-binding HxlR family transcriptional regulator